MVLIAILSRAGGSCVLVMVLVVARPRDKHFLPSLTFRLAQLPSWEGMDVSGTVIFPCNIRQHLLCMQHAQDRQTAAHLE